MGYTEGRSETVSATSFLFVSAPARLAPAVKIVGEALASRIGGDAEDCYRTRWEWE